MTIRTTAHKTLDELDYVIRELAEADKTKQTFMAGGNHGDILRHCISGGSSKAFTWCSMIDELSNRLTDMIMLLLSPMMGVRVWNLLSCRMNCADPSPCSLATSGNLCTD